MAKSRRIAYKRKRKESKKVRKPLRKQRLQLYNRQLLPTVAV